MAGGKETPRQKMIGMMYLVLTALLALNVSKSVLDAFVAIEENIQKANIVQADRGDGFYNDVKSEISATKGEDQKLKKQKLEYVTKKMEAINDETAKLVEFIDGLKVEILKAAGENVGAPADKSEEAILWRKQEGVKPQRMNLAAVQGQDKYDEPMLVLGINEDIKNPKGKGKELWDKYNKFREDIVRMTGSYKFPGTEKEFNVSVKPINTFESNKKLEEEVKKMIDGLKDKANLKEDRQVLIDLYMMLTKQEKNDHHDVKDVHWIGKTFDHSPLVAGVASLSSMQQDILSARALALAHWKSKVSTGEYSFNKIMPLAYGPAVANSGDSVQLKVMMAAFDSDNQPDVTIEGMEGATIRKNNGQGLITVRAGGSTMDLKGTVSIKNKSGVKKTETWEHRVTIMKPSGSIELPEMNMLYRGYANKVNATASGYPETRLTGTGVNISRSGDGYIVKPSGKGKTATLSVSGVTADGKSVSLKSLPFRCSNLPDPDIYWGGSKNGSRASKSATKLFAKYGPEIPLNVAFRITRWECSVAGAIRPIKGSGDNIAAAGPLLRAAKPGSQVSFICYVVGPDGIQRKRAGAFTI